MALPILKPWMDGIRTPLKYLCSWGVSCRVRWCRLALPAITADPRGMPLLPGEYVKSAIALLITRFSKKKNQWHIKPEKIFESLLPQKSVGLCYVMLAICIPLTAVTKVVRFCSCHIHNSSVSTICGWKQIGQSTKKLAHCYPTPSKR